MMGVAEGLKYDMGQNRRPTFGIRGMDKGLFVNFGLGRRYEGCSRRTFRVGRLAIIDLPEPVKSGQINNGQVSRDLPRQKKKPVRS